MKNNSRISMFALTLLMSLFLVSFASAAISITPATQTIESGKDAKITVQNTGNETNIKLEDSGAFDVKFFDNTTEITTFTLLAINGTIKDFKDIIVRHNPIDLSKLKFGTNTVTITAVDADNATTNPTATLTFSKTFCKNGAAGGNLSITDVNIDNSGDDDDVWKPLDKIDVEVKVENEGDENIDDVVVELGLFDSAGKNQANDLVFESSDSEEIKIGKIRDGDKETVTFTFTIPADFEDGSYKLAIKALSEDLKESVECTDSSDELSDNFFESIDVEREDDEGKFIAFDNIEVRPSEASCGDNVVVELDVFNVGDEEQDQIRVNLFSSELGLRLSREIREDMDSGDKARVSFDFIVPQNLQDKLYRLELSAEYDYTNGAYKESSDEPTQFTLKIIGCSITPPSESIAAISARLDSDAKAGEELIVKVNIANLLSKEADFAIRPTKFESWGELKSISDRLVHLNKGEAKEITLNFNVNKDATGEQAFDLEVVGDGKLEAKEVQVNVEGAEQPSGGLDISGLKGSNLIWVIGAINVVLIILIIVVAVRLSRK